MNRSIIIIVLILLLLFLWVHYAFADTTIKYQGMPPNSYAPSVSAFGNDLCRTGISGGANNGIIALSGGITIIDENCERIKLSRQLDSIGLKVAAVAVLCEDPRVFRAMLQAGSPCSIQGSIGDAALHAWYELKPEIFEDLYGKDWRPPTITHPLD